MLIMVIHVVTQVETLEDMSSRERAGARCYDTILLCKPHGLWNRRPDWMKQAWHHFLKFGDFGQQVIVCTEQFCLMLLLLLLLLLLTQSMQHAIVNQAVVIGSQRT